MKKQNLDTLFNPASIAIVGATDTKGKVGAVITKNISKLGYRGEIFFVNPSRQSSFFKKYYPDLKSVGKVVDLAVVAIPAKIVSGAVKSGAKYAKNFAVISAGFSEIGVEGKKREKELLALAQKNKVNILGPNCLGFIIPRLKLNASFAGGMPKPGNIALISQSGALAVALMNIAEKENFGFSAVVSVGNKTQIGEAELIEYFGADPATKVIGLYLESVKNGKDFIEAVQKVSSQKPVVILKAGKTEKAQKAIQSHTGALAGSDEIISAVLEKLGVIQAENLEEFLGFVKFLSSAKKIKNGEVAIVTNAGGAGVLISDAFEGKSIRPSEFSPKLKNALKKILPEESSVENPVDVLGDADQERYEKSLAILEKAKSGSIISILTPQDQTPVKEVASELIRFGQWTDKMLLTSFIGGTRIEEAVARLEKNGIVNFRFPEQAVSTLDKYFRWAEFSRSKFSGQIKIDKERRKRIAEIIKQVRSRGRQALLFGEAAKIFELYEISIVDFRQIKLGDVFNNLKFPVALKVDSDKILHKTDKKGLLLGISNAEELADAVKTMNSSFPRERFIVQPMLKGGVELILGMKRDAVFGPVVIFGLGGIYAEVLRLVDFLIPPMDIANIKKALEKSKIGFFFKETRGQHPYDIEKIAAIIQKLMQLSLEANEIKELDINPLFIYNDGREAQAADVKIIV